jgi:hypothetical protein
VGQGTQGDQVDDGERRVRSGPADVDQEPMAVEPVTIASSAILPTKTNEYRFLSGTFWRLGTSSVNWSGNPY